MSYFVYIIECSDGHIYTGMTSNLKRRIKQHKQGLSIHTKNRLSIKFIYKEIFSSKEDAAEREKEIKGWSRIKKEKLIKE